MAIQFSGGTIVNDSWTLASSNPSADFATHLLAALVAAGWTNVAVGSFATLTISGIPANNDTVTIDSITYTWKTSINNATPYEVFRGASASDAVTALSAAIVAGAGAGTLYSTATTAHPTCTVTTSTSSTIKVSTIATGLLSNTGVVSTESGSNTSWSTSTLRSGYNDLTCAKTPQGLRCLVELTLTGGTSIFDAGVALDVKIGDPTKTRLSVASISNTNQPILNGSTPVMRIVASKYNFFSWAEGLQSGQTAGVWIAVGVPYIHPFQAGIVVSAATNATPIVLTTATPHGSVSGDTALVTSAVGNTAANGQWVVTVIDPTHLSLDTSVGNGTYTANSAVFGNSTRSNAISEAIYGGGTSGGGTTNWRANIQQGTASWTSINANVAVSAGDSQSNAAFDVPSVASQTFSGTDLQWYNLQYVITEPIVSWGKVYTGQPYLIGQLWNCALVRRTISLDQATDPFDGHNWVAAGVHSSPATGYTLLVATD